jgi:transposase InsO family protein
MCSSTATRRGRPVGVFAVAIDLAGSLITTNERRDRLGRAVGQYGRECLDWLIPLNERHLRGILRAWVTHYNRGRPHASLGPGIPEASPRANPLVATGHHIPARCRVVATPILNGLHHEYHVVPEAA